MYSLTFIEYIICSLALSSNNLRGKTVSTLGVRVSVPLDDELKGIALAKAFLHCCSTISYINTTSIVVKGSSSISTRRSN